MYKGIVGLPGEHGELDVSERPEMPLMDWFNQIEPLWTRKGQEITLLSST